VPERKEERGPCRQRFWDNRYNRSEGEGRQIKRTVKGAVGRMLAIVHAGLKERELLMQPYFGTTGVTDLKETNKEEIWGGGRAKGRDAENRRVHKAEYTYTMGVGLQRKGEAFRRGTLRRRLGVSVLPILARRERIWYPGEA
jgi:hypothetical protein